LKYLLKVKRIGIIFFLEGIEIMALESCGRPYIYTHSTGIDAYVGDIRQEQLLISELYKQTFYIIKPDTFT
jgi:hypothetical protein